MKKIQIKESTTNKKFQVVYDEVRVYKDSYEQGEGEYVNGYDLSLKNKIFNSIEDIIDIINKEFGIKYSPKEWSYMSGESRMFTSILVDEDSSGYISKSDLSLWKKGELILYSANVDITLKTIAGTYDTTDEEFEEAGISE